MLSNSGFTALFMDNDAVILSDPFKFTSPDKYDLEGLSDWVRSDTRPTPLVRACSGCSAAALAQPSVTLVGAGNAALSLLLQERQGEDARCAAQLGAPEVLVCSS